MAGTQLDIFAVHARKEREAAAPVLPSDVAALVHFLGRGQGQAVTGRELVGRLGVSGAEVRALVNQARHHGVLVGSTTDAGYWLCENEEEVRRTAAHLKSRIRAQVEVLRAFDRAAAARLQMALDLERGSL
jgi:biotin operon repressor